MSMPVITPGTTSRDQAISDIITSVALEQTGLAHILNAEGEKIQKVVSYSDKTEEMIEVNKSVQNVINAIFQLELVLKSKLEIFQCNICPDDVKA
ncbi:MAG TPA: hypothetical protein IAC62_10470 [Candidatus Pelethocola excrementipullorum]|nr:hypothetical protein [Candidatus Pelethocola excrementipullorum]